LRALRSKFILLLPDFSEKFILLLPDFSEKFILLIDPFFKNAPVGFISWMMTNEAQPMGSGREAHQISPLTITILPVIKPEIVVVVKPDQALPFLFLFRRFGLSDQSRYILSIFGDKKKWLSYKIHRYPQILGKLFCRLKSHIGN